MKRITFLLLLLPLLWLGCEEIPPIINPNMGGNNPDGPTPVEDQERQVLIEEFTGVRCVNCPAGSQAIEGLLDIYGQRLVAISIHAGSFSAPYPDSQTDFRAPEGISLLSYLGEPLGYPTAVVDRKLFDGEFDLQLGRQQWAGYVAQELQETPRVKIEIKRTYEESTRQLDVKVKLYVQETIAENDVRLSIALTESEITDLQLTPESSTPNSAYKHQHVLRDMMTNYDGDPIDEPLPAGAVIEKDYSMALPESWKPDDCHIVAFVNLGGASKEVLQVHQVAVVE